MAIFVHAVESSYSYVGSFCVSPINKSIIYEVFVYFSYDSHDMHWN